MLVVLLIKLAKDHLHIYFGLMANTTKHVPLIKSLFRHRCGDTAGAAAAVVLVDPAATAYK